MRLLPLLFVLLAPSTPALACLSGTEPAFDSMIRGSTLIVRGQVFRETTRDEGNLQPGSTEHVSDLLIQRVYKGAASAVIRVRWKEYALCPRARLAKDDYGLFFLHARGSEFVLVDEQFGKVPVSRWQDASQPEDPIVAMERDFKRAIQNDSGRQRIEDVLLLGSLYRPMGTAELRGLLPTDDKSLESAVHLALLKLQDYSRLEAAGRLVETVPENQIFVFPKDEGVYLRRTIGIEIGSQIGRIKDRSQLSVLQRFSLTSDDWLRQNAAYALRHLQSSSNVPYLIRLIDDPSEHTRLQAMRGLQELLKPGTAGYGWLSSSSLNRKTLTEEEAAARWRVWWQSEGKARYGK